MRLRELLAYDNIVIQCHDNPDADAIASGFGVLLYLRAKGKKARFLYGGRHAIRKSNMVLMLELLHIPAEHVESLEEVPPLLVTVDCRYGERNVQHFPAEEIAVIDHHISPADQLPALSEVRDKYGACATIVWDLLLEEGFDVSGNRDLCTALYYGLYMDTCKMQELHHPMDKDMRDALEFCMSSGTLFQLQNSNLSRSELAIAGKAMADIGFSEEHSFAVIGAERCDANILGIISDALIEVDTVNACIVFCRMDDGIKLSVRTCHRSVRADELASFVCQGIGSGGGHLRKAGGFLSGERLEEAYTARYGMAPDSVEHGTRRFLEDRLREYFSEQDLIAAGGDAAPDLTGAPVYEKKRLPIGYVKATDMYPAGTPVSVRMLEGDIPLLIQEDTYLIIGIEGEVYQNSEAYFLSHNDPTDEPYEIRGEYAPKVHTAVSAVTLTSDSREEQREKPLSLKDFARTCIPKESSRVYARPVEKRTKVFVSWTDSYLLGNPGDFLAARVENPKDIYIIKKEIMERSYTESKY